MPTESASPRPSRLTVWALALLGLLALGTAPAAASVSDLGVRGETYPAAEASPTQEKGQSKLWYNDGFWWADQINQATARHQIMRLDRTRQVWVNTGTVLDARPGTRSDIIWDGTKLYVASHVYAASSAVNATGKPTLLLRYSYNRTTKRYALDAGFPTKINDVSSEQVVLSRDYSGRLWATWTEGRRAAVVRSAVGGTSWERAFAIPVPGASGMTADDLSVISSYGNQTTGAVWSNQSTSSLWFASHDDRITARSGWTATRITQGSKAVDDHLSLKTLANDRSGRLFLVAKTSQDDASPLDPAAPLIQLWVRNGTTGAWTSSVVSTVADNHTRPVLELDLTHKQVLVFLTGPSTAGSRQFEGSIYLKSAMMTNPIFVSGEGTPVIRDAGSAHLNDVTSTKQTVVNSVGLVAMASDRTTLRYWHADVPLQDALR